MTISMLWQSLLRALMFLALSASAHSLALSPGLPSPSQILVNVDSASVNARVLSFSSSFASLTAFRSPLSERTMPGMLMYSCSASNRLLGSASMSRRMLDRRKMRTSGQPDVGLTSIVSDFPLNAASQVPLLVVSLTRSCSGFPQMEVTCFVRAPLRSSMEPSLPSHRNENPSTMEDFPVPLSPKTIVTFFSGSKSIVAGLDAPRKATSTSCLSFVFPIVLGFLCGGIQLEEHLPLVGSHLPRSKFVRDALEAVVLKQLLLLKSCHDLLADLLVWFLHATRHLMVNNSRSLTCCSSRFSTSSSKASFRASMSFAAFS